MKRITITVTETLEDGKEFQIVDSFTETEYSHLQIPEAFLLKKVSKMIHNMNIAQKIHKQKQQ
jgi:hypothetical protein